MFICKITDRVTKPGEAMNKIVIATRERVYMRKFRNEETGRWEDVEVGRGWEIVKEVPVSEEGLAAWNDLSDDQRERLAKILLTDGHL